jgi:hypothetical protein
MYVIFVAFPLQQLLRKLSSMLLSGYIIWLFFAIESNWTERTKNVDEDNATQLWQRKGANSARIKHCRQKGTQTVYLPSIKLPFYAK